MVSPKSRRKTRWGELGLGVGGHLLHTDPSRQLGLFLRLISGGAVEQVSWREDEVGRDWGVGRSGRQGQTVRDLERQTDGCGFAGSGAGKMTC